jgi:Cd2+/Zn2+-exporting ATPase
LGKPNEPHLRVEGLDCPSCALKAEAGARSAPGVASAEFRRRVILASASGVWLALAFGLRYLGRGAPGGTFVAGAVTAAFLVSAALGGFLVAGKALRSLRRRVVNFEVLVVIAATGAIAIGDLAEAALVVFLFSVGEALETAGVARTRRALSSLLDLVPRMAMVRRGATEEEIPAAEVAVGDTVIIRPGERLPVDGRVLAGRSFVNQAPVTGESMPAAKVPGDEVFAGSVNGAGVLEVASTRDPDDTTLARLVHLVEEAQLEKAGHQKLVDRFAASYTPVVVGFALVIGLGLPLILGRPFEPYVYRALALLLVACPCALVLSTPVAVVSAIGHAARRGVLIKGGSALEAAGRVRAVAFDKTGTLTAGRPEVSDLLVSPEASGTAGVGSGSLGGTGAAEAAERLTEKELLSLAAAVERWSEHPVAEAVRRKAGEWGVAEDASARNFESIPGRGAKARVGGRNCYVGSEALFEQDLAVSRGALVEAGDRLERQGKTVVYVGHGDSILGLIAVSDVIRPEAAEAVAALRRAGVDRLYLLTGDNPVTAQAVSEALGLDGYRAGLLPEGKVAAVRELAALGPGDRRGVLAMVGDGINDAPALAAAGIGVAMGVAGTDLAVEAADVALMSDDLGRVAYTVRLGRRAVGVIRQNIVAALGIKAVALVLAAAGFLPLWLAVLADTGNTVLVILNGLRLLGGRGE